MYHSLCHCHHFWLSSGTKKDVFIYFLCTSYTSGAVLSGNAFGEVEMSAIRVAVDYVNKRDDVLPNVTLEYVHMYSSNELIPLPKYQVIRNYWHYQTRLVDLLNQS